jgi:hypothetical protein
MEIPSSSTDVSVLLLVADSKQSSDSREPVETQALLFCKPLVLILGWPPMLKSAMQVTEKGLLIKEEEYNS